MQTRSIPTRAGAMPDARTTRRGIVAFLLIAFGLAWAPFLPALVGGAPFGMILMPIAPAAACIIVRKWVTREGFNDAGLRPKLRRWRLYLLALGWTVAQVTLATCIAFLLGVALAGSLWMSGLA